MISGAVGVFVPYEGQPAQADSRGLVMRDVEAELTRTAHEWDRAMIENDAEEIGRFMSDDWIIIGSDGSVADKANFLNLVQSGLLSHDVMESHEIQVRVYGDAAVVVAQGISGGTYRGQQFYLTERSSCVFVRQEERWLCVSTHLSQIAGGQGVAAPEGKKGRT